MVTYLCRQCGADFARLEQEIPECFGCGHSKGHKILSKKECTPEVMAERIRLSTNRMMENLKKAWEVRPKEIREDPKAEKEFLKLLNRAKELRNHTHEAMDKMEEEAKNNREED